MSECTATQVALIVTVLAFAVAGMVSNHLLNRMSLRMEHHKRSAEAYWVELDRWGHDKDCARLRARFLFASAITRCDCNIEEEINPVIDADAGRP